MNLIMRKQTEGDSIFLKNYSVIFITVEILKIKESLRNYSKLKDPEDTSQLNVNFPIKDIIGKVGKP